MQLMLFGNTKVCRKCCQEKALTKFYKDINGKYGRTTNCKKCHLKEQKSRYNSDRTSIKKCEVCGSKIKSKYGKKYCDECIERKGTSVKHCNVYYFECKGCGKLSTTGNKRRANYCTHECYSENSEKEYRNTCNTCGKEYISGSPTSKYCSNKCRNNTSNIYTGQCNGCGSSFVSRYKKKYCSDSCYHKQVVPYKDNCIVCGNKFVVNYGAEKYCSNKCRKKQMALIRKRYRHIKGNHRKRARYFNVKYEKVDKTNVFERDNYKCTKCGVKCDISKVGTNHDEEPTLDHIIPMSKGGPHTYDNVQTLCRNCNTKKGNSLIGQRPIIFTRGRVFSL